MKVMIQNSLAVLAGLVLGSMVNMGLIAVSGSIIPPPEGADVTTMEGLRESMHLFQPKNFLFPFLAHAIGTLMGAAITARIAVRHKMKFAFAIGVVFLLGGIINIFLLPSPMWYAIVDGLGAYIPMAWIGGKLVTRKKLINTIQ